MPTTQAVLDSVTRECKNAGMSAANIKLTMASDIVQAMSHYPHQVDYVRVTREVLTPPERQGKTLSTTTFRLYVHYFDMGLVSAKVCSVTHTLRHRPSRKCHSTYSKDT